MFKKICISIISVVLLLSICFAFPIQAMAINESNKVYYSDLFYLYDSIYLLPDNTNESIGSYYLYYHSLNTSVMLEQIYNNYAESDEGYWMAFKTGLDASMDIFHLDLRQFAGLFLDNYGGTDTVYQGALRSANKEFAKQLLSGTDAVSNDDVMQFSGTVADIAGQIGAVGGAFQKFLDVYDIDKMSSKELFYKVFEFLEGELIFSYYKNSDFSDIKDKILDTIDDYTKLAGGIEECLKIAEVLVTFLMLESLRASLINDILDSTPENSSIHEGMQLLKNDFSGKFVSYFCHNYLNEKAIKTVLDAMTEKVILPKVSIITAVIEVLSFVVFDVIFDIPNLTEFTTQKVLSDYASDLYQVLKGKINEFDVQFDSDDIKEFEVIFYAYDSATRAAVSYSNETLRVDETSNILDALMNSNWYITFCYQNYIESIIGKIESIPRSERQCKFFYYWLYKDGSEFRSASDQVELGGIYLSNGTFNGNLTIKSSAMLKIDDGRDMIIAGNLEITSGYGNITITVPQGSNLLVNGALSVRGLSGGRAHLKNCGTIICEGDASFLYDGYTGYGYYQPFEDSLLVLKRNLTIESDCDFYLDKGTIEFAGTTQQEVKLPKAYNIEVTNPAGIKYLESIKLYGTYNLNGNPLENGTRTTYLYGDAKLDDSDFKQVYIDATYTIKSNINANVVIDAYGSNVTLYIPEGFEATIGGTLKLRASSVYKSCLSNKGTLICNGNIEFIDNGYGAYGYYYPSASSLLIVKGNITAPTSAANSIVQGTIEFAGTGKQTVNIYQAYIVEITNTSDDGVVIESINVQKLFDHKGNKFTVRYGTFVDYDKDGLKDNVDPHPTIPESEFKFTVIFKYDNGDVISTATYCAGDTVVVPKDPTKADDNTYTYSFSGWDKPITEVQGDEVYVAVFTPTYIEYMVTFLNYDGSILSTGLFHYGDALNVSSKPLKPHDDNTAYEFDGWGSEFPMTCVGNAIYTAVYKEIPFGDSDGNGNVNGRDVIFLRQYMANLDFSSGTSSVEASAAADVNCDGKVNGRDVLLLRLYMANFDFTMGTSSVVLGPQK